MLINSTLYVNNITINFILSIVICFHLYLQVAPAGLHPQQGLFFFILTTIFFYYIIDQQKRGDIPVKIVFDDVTINNIRYKNADENGTQEIFDGDIMVLLYMDFLN